MIKNIDQINIIVSDLQKTTDFFLNLGFEKYPDKR